MTVDVRATGPTMRLRRRVLPSAIAVFLVTSVASFVVEPAAANDDPPGVMIAFDRDTGRELWRVDTLPSFGLTDVSSGTVVGRGGSCGGPGFENVGLATRNGHTRWRSPAAPDAGVRGGDLASDGSERSGIVVVRSDDDEFIEGRDARSGEVRWTMRSVPYSDVQVNADSVAVFTDTNRRRRQRITVLDRRTGEQEWSRSYPRGHEIWSMLGDRVVTVTESEGNHTKNLGTEVLDVRDGSVRWTADLAPIAFSNSVSALAVAGAALATNLSPALEVRDTTTGALLWTRDQASLVGAQGDVVIETWPSPVPPSPFDVSDARTGAGLWSAATVDWQPLLDRDVVAYSPEQGVLVVADAANGVPRRRTALPQARAEIPSTSTAIGRDAVYVTIGCYPLD